MIDRIRADFPALCREVNGHPAAFFDGPAGSQVPRQVIERVADYLAHHNANTGGDFATSRETDAMIAEARGRMAALLGAPDGRGVVFGANMTTLTFSLSRSLRHTWGPGDEVVVTELDHQANVAPWVRAAQECGAAVRVVPFHHESCTLDLDALEAALSPRTRLVAVGWASNAVGSITDVARVCELARGAGALTFVDAVHYAPHRVMDVQAIGCDFLACSAYKFFGPHIGVLWGREALLRELVPYKVPPATDESPGRWETGTLSHEGIAGAAAAVDWIASLGAAEGRGGSTGLRERVMAGMRVIEAVEQPLMELLLEGLAGIRGARVHGPPAGHPRTPTVALTLEGVAAPDIARRLAEVGVFCWAGDFYASTVIDRLGLRERGGVVRIGLAPYNSAGEVDRLLAALRALSS
jgi:cysteine desulfurase family protein (TIGR01976 family)